VLYERLSIARQRLLHRRVARILARHQQPSQATALLVHAQRGHEWQLAFTAARQAAALARRVAARAEAIAFEQAALAALDIIGDDPALRFSILLVCESDAHLLGRRAEQAALLDALDYYMCDQSQQALALYRRGRYLGALTRWQEAQALLEWALDLAADAELRCDVQLILATCYYHNGDQNAAIVLAQQALTESEAPSAAPRRLRTLLVLARLAQMQEASEQALIWLKKAQPLAHGQPEVQAELLYTLARNRVRQGDYNQILRDATRGYQAAQLVGDVQMQADCLRLRGLAAGRLYHFAEAEEIYRSANALYATLENPQGQAAVTLNLAIVRYRIGDFAAAREAAHAAYALAQQINDRRGQAIVAINLAAILIVSGDGAAAEHWAHTALERTAALDLPLYHVLATTNLAGALLRQGRLVEARVTFEHALALRPANDIGRITDAIWLAWTCMVLNDLAAADDHSAVAVAALETTPGIDIPQQVYAVRALVLHHRGDAVGAAHALARAAHTLRDRLNHIPSAVDRRRYSRALATNRFIRAAQKNKWDAENPLF